MCAFCHIFSHRYRSVMKLYSFFLLGFPGFSPFSFQRGSQLSALTMLGLVCPPWSVSLCQCAGRADHHHAWLLFIGNPLKFAFRCWEWKHWQTHLTLQVTVHHVGKSGQELKPWRKAHGLLHYLSYTHQDHLPRPIWWKQFFSWGLQMCVKSSKLLFIRDLS